MHQSKPQSGTLIEMALKVPTTKQARETALRRDMSLELQRKLFNDLSADEDDELCYLMFNIGIRYDNESIIQFLELLQFLSALNRWRRIIPQTQVDVLEMIELYAVSDISNKIKNDLSDWLDRQGEVRFLKK